MNHPALLPYLKTFQSRIYFFYHSIYSTSLA